MTVFAIVKLKMKKTLKLQRDIEPFDPSRKGGNTKDLYCYIKVLNVKPVYQQMTLSPKLGVVEISTLWHFRLPFG